MFSSIDTKQYEFKEIDSENEHSQDVGYFVLTSDKEKIKEIFHVEMFSSSGQTQYYVFEDVKTKVWYIKKTAIFYERPFELDDTETKDSYFCYKESVPYWYNPESGMYEENVDTDFIPAVVDYRHLNDLITDLTGL